MSYTSQKIQSMIDSNAGLIFTYNYSRPEILRFVHPISIVGDNVVGTETHTKKIKKFKLNGIQLYLKNQPIYDTECEAYKLKKLNQLYINTKLEESQIHNHDISDPNTPRNWVEEYANILLSSDSCQGVPSPNGPFVSECGCVQECYCGECDYCIINEGYGCGCE